MSPITTEERRQMLCESGYFDADWYLRRYPDVAHLGLDPLEHFLRFGGLLRRSPSAQFDTGFYVGKYGAVIDRRINPLLDFLVNGQSHGRLARPHQGRAALILVLSDAADLAGLQDRLADLKRFDQTVVLAPVGGRERAEAWLASRLAKASLFEQSGNLALDLVDIAASIRFREFDAICLAETEGSGLDHLPDGPDGIADLIGRFASEPQLSMLSNEAPEAPGDLPPRLRAALGLPPAGTVTADLTFARPRFWVRGVLLDVVIEAIDRSRIAETSETSMTDLIAAGCLAMSAANAPQPPGAAHPSDTTASDAQGQDMNISTVKKLFPKTAATMRALKPRGALDGAFGPNLKGWLAQIGDEVPRKATVRIGSHRLSALANAYRDDLKNAGINEGRHAFQILVPPEICDGKPREVELIDEASGATVARRTVTWARPERSYHDFQGFLKSSMTQPQIDAPFIEEDKRCFAQMEKIANELCRRAKALEDPPLVSVIMPMFNRETVVGTAIASVLAQTYGRFELIVIDDGSSDGSVAAVRAVADPRIRLIELDRNCGVTVARNAGLRQAQGEVIAYLDSDNAWDPRFLAAHVAALDRLPHADMIYSGALLFAGDSTVPHAIRYAHLNVALLENRNFIDNNVIVHRRAFLDRLGGFDESLRRFVDWDLALRATELGTVVSVPVLLCNYHYQRAENAITDDVTHLGHRDILRDKQAARRAAHLAMLGQAELTRPVAVVIPNWESLEDISECIEALDGRDWQGMLRIIVVDNASCAEVRAYLRAQHAAGRITHHQFEQNFGFTLAVNKGIELAGPGVDIVLLNNDAIAQPGAIQELQRACLARPDLGMAVPRQILPAGTKTLRTHVPFADEGCDCDVNISAHHRNIAHVPTFHDGGELELSYAAFFAVYIRHELIAEIGPLDAEYGRHYRSDRTYCDTMLSLTTYRMIYTPQSHFIHKLQKATDRMRDSGTRDDEFDLMFRRNQWDAGMAAELGYRTAPWDRV
ncbi:glycosyltransferase [Paracoccus ravus]|uniref:glycosyltransferase n=1 Tax=Paracoccus ravus TaxID=2447760 RepID=UPI00106EA159|nr:glycosyltransferase [Paracoccus ravus]